MAAKSGERAEETGGFRCEKCHNTVHVTRGKTIPRRPHYGGRSFDTRRNEPGSRSS